jgi:trigger factor
MATEAAGLKVSIEKPAAWARRLTITVPAAEVAREKQNAVKRLAKRVHLPGFRPGKAPVSRIEKQYGPALEQEVVEKVIGDAYKAALVQTQLQPITEGSIDRIDYEPGSDLTFNVEVEVRPELELERVGGFVVVREQPPVGEDQIDEVLQRLRAEHAVWRPKEGGTPVAGDMASVEIVPLDAATSAEPAQPRHYQVVIGEGQALAAVEDSIRMLTAGEEGEFDVVLPENPDDPDGPARQHRMRIRLIEVKAPEYPPLDDEFAQSVGDFADLAALRARIRVDMEREAAREAERGVRMQLVQNVIRANPFEVPQSMVRQYLERVIPDRDGAATDRLQELRMQMWPAAEQALKRMLVLERIAELESLRATPAELDARIDQLAERLGRGRGEVIVQLRKSGQLDELEQEITEEKVFAYLKSLSEIQ